MYLFFNEWLAKAPNATQQMTVSNTVNAFMTPNYHRYYSPINLMTAIKETNDLIFEMDLQFSICSYFYFFSVFASTYRREMTLKLKLFVFGFTKVIRHTFIR